MYEDKREGGWRNTKWMYFISIVVAVVGLNTILFQFSRSESVVVGIGAAIGIMYFHPWRLRHRNKHQV